MPGPRRPSGGRGHLFPIRTIAAAPDVIEEAGQGDERRTLFGGLTGTERELHQLEVLSADNVEPLALGDSLEVRSRGPVLSTAIQQFFPGLSLVLADPDIGPDITVARDRVRHARGAGCASAQHVKAIVQFQCLQACPVDAILGAAKQMHTVIANECTGCDLCVEPCPVDCIDMIPVETTPRSWVWDKPGEHSQLIATDKIGEIRGAA